MRPLQGQIYMQRLRDCLPVSEDIPYKWLGLLKRINITLVHSLIYRRTLHFDVYKEYYSHSVIY